MPAIGQLGSPLAPSAPSIFAVDSNGIGQAAVLNEDNSLNGASNPAGGGTVVQVFATGGGQTMPPNVTGTLAGNSLDTTALPVTVTVGGADAPVMYRGSAPGEVAGVLQVNARHHTRPCGAYLYYRGRQTVPKRRDHCSEVGAYPNTVHLGP